MAAAGFLQGARRGGSATAAAPRRRHPGPHPRPAVRPLKEGTIVNWPPLLLLALVGTPAVVLTLRGKAPRLCGLLAGAAALCLVAGVPALQELVHRHWGVGVVLIVLVVAVMVGLLFFYLDFFRGEHRAPVFGRKGGGAPAQ